MAVSGRLPSTCTALAPPVKLLLDVDRKLSLDILLAESERGADAPVVTVGD